jgi:hypothetical protein
MNTSKPRFAIIFLEAAVALIGGWLSFFKLEGQAAIVCAFGTLVYAVLTAKLELHFAAEDRLFAKFPILSSLRHTDIDHDLIQVLERFHDIHHPLLVRIKKSMWDSFASEVSSLFLLKRSESITPAEYIELIETELINSPANTHIIALSLYLPSEFCHNTFENNFHAAQKEAIARGVTIERIFVCSRARMEDLKSTNFWDDHIGAIDGRFADEEEVSKTGIKIQGGFIFINKALFTDRPLASGLSGVVSVNEQDIDKARREFLVLRKHARPLREIFS